MNKLPAKQILLLIFIIAGICALSVYSTYSIFTLEADTDDIVNINTPNSIALNTETYEYKQVIVPKNSYITTDIDIYNNTSDSLCYGIWYRINSTKANDKIKIYENTESSLTTSGVIDSITSKRVNLLITNDNNTDVTVNIGLSYEKNSDSCSLNLTGNRTLVTSTITNPLILANALIRSVKETNETEGYLTYKNNEEKISILSNTNLHVSTSFNYKEEMFSLNDPKKITTSDIEEYISNEAISYYTCLDTDECRMLYKINAVSITEEEISLNKYDVLVGYLAGETGLRKVDNDYLYYGDNPHNFIYYNCKNEVDTNSCELWRIMGFYYNQENNKYLTKIIKDSSLGTYSYSEENNLFNNSNIFGYLNKEYKINENLLTEIIYNEEYVTNDENNTPVISNHSDKINAKVTLMTLTDYLNSSICQNKNPANYENSCIVNNWLNKGTYEFTMTSKLEKTIIDPETETEIIPDNNKVYIVGPSLKETLINEKNQIRPVIYLKERTMLISGNGTIDNPYIIK